MDSDNADALAFLRSKRADDTQGAPEASEENHDHESEEVDADSDLEDEAQQEETIETYDEQEESYFDIDGEEITLDQIREWKRGFLRESDYTQKTQSLSAERKEFEGMKAKTQEKLQKLDSTISDLESLLQTEEDAIDWDELIETDPSQYLKLQKKQADRRSKLKAAQDRRQAEVNKAQEDYLKQQMVKMRELAPDWIDETGKYTDSMSSDIGNIQAYLQSKAFSSDDINQVVDARLWAVFRDAARYNSLKDKKPSVDKQMKKAPKVIKPTKGSRKAVKPSRLDDAAKQFKRSGSEKDAMAYLRARRN